MNMIDEKRILDCFGNEMRSRMFDLGIRAGHISYDCKINKRNVYDYMAGQCLPSPWYIVLVAERLNCSVNELLGFGSFKDGYVYKASEKYAGENQFAEVLRDQMVHYMNEQDMTIETLSEATGITVKTINQWFTNWPRLPRTMHLIRVCSALNCTPSDLLGY